MLAGTFFTAISQVLLKQSANKKYSNPLLEYLNWRVIVAYGIFSGDRYGCVCICSDLFKSDPERKDHKRKTCGKPADHSRNFDLYDVR